MSSEGRLVPEFYGGSLTRGRGKLLTGSVELVPVRRTLALLFSLKRLEVKQDLISDRR